MLEAPTMSKWFRKCLALTPDIRPAGRYDDCWHGQLVPDWLARQTCLLEETAITDRPDRLTPYNTVFEADVPGLTAYGGMALFIGFTQKIGFSDALRSELCFPKRKSAYNPLQLAECTVDAIACGIHRIENTNLLKDDPLLPAARGLARYPDHATMHRYITAFTREQVEQIHRASARLFKKANRTKRPTRVTLDFDATDAVVYGQQEEAAFGHKNAKDGHREYAVEVCFLGGSKDALHHQVRRGGTHSSPAFAQFFKEALSRLPEGMEAGLIRSDAGYFSLENLQALEAANVPYLMGCPVYGFLREQAYAKNEWKRISREEEVTSFEYAFGDGVTRRVLVARHPDAKKARVKADGQPALIEMPEQEKYTHFACVTQIRTKSGNALWQSYAGRSNMENAIKESKLGFGLEALPSKQFAANQAYVAFVFLAYNLVNWFKRLAFGTDDMARRQVKALRQWVLCVPALVERCADHWRVRLPERHPSLPLFRQIQSFLARGMPAMT
jgi:hypothetical protein